jgi:hypothetical protein
MKVGLWGAPAVLGGLVGLLWVAAWLERLLERPTYDAQVEQDLESGQVNA